MRYVNFAGHARMIGQFVDVLITEVMANSLRGRVLATPDNSTMRAGMARIRP
jgi:tRNA-2-methylthio-N6-dimethylallyladenosine synthase